MSQDTKACATGWLSSDGAEEGLSLLPPFSLFSFLTVSLIYPLSPLSPSEQVGGLRKGLARPPCPYFPMHMRSLCLVKMELEAEEPPTGQQQLQGIPVGR